MSKKIIILIGVFAGGVIGGVLGYLHGHDVEPIAPNNDSAPVTDQDPTETTDRRAVAATLASDDGEVIVIQDTNGDEVTYTIEAFNTWTEDNWDDVFTERPSFGEMREVAFTDFPRFSRSVSVSPDGTTVMFSVFDYAAASTMSFVGFLDVATMDVTLVPETFAGDVRSVAWAPNGSALAFRLDTARAAGDGLAVVDVAAATALRTRDGADILEALDRTDVSSNQFLPDISDVAWANNQSITFSTAHPDDGRITWSMRRDGGLTRE